MAEGKKKVIVYTDWISQFNDLTDEEAGRLIKHFFRYVNDLNPESDRLTELLFNPIKATLKRDLESWQNKQKINRENGAKGGRPKAQINPNNPVGFSETQNNPKKGVKDSVSVSVNDSVSDIVNKKNDIDERKLKFASTLKPFVEVYGREMINDFFKYWTEPNKSNTKFKQELEKTWSVDRRLETWSKNDFGKSKAENQTKPNSYTPIKLID
jgi:hypothetical protein